jgi:RNA-binding protein
MSESELTGKQRRYLRGLGHNLEAIVQIGKEGVTSGLVAAVDEVLTQHELVKVKLLQAAPVDRHAAATEIATQTRSAVVQVLGSTVLLYRAHPDEPTIDLP